MKKLLSFATLILAVSTTAVPLSSFAQTPAAKPSASRTAATPAPTDAEIADAKSKGLVWVNLNTKVYHKDDSKYGKTKKGKFMTEADAMKAGYHLAKVSPIGHKKQSPPAGAN